MDSALFVDCIGICKNLRKLNMQHCIQFSEYQLARTARQVKELTYLEMSNSSEITYTNAYIILGNLPHLEMVNFDPKGIPERCDDFKHLMNLFWKVHFGVNITRHLPFFVRNQFSGPED